MALTRVCAGQDEAREFVRLSNRRGCSKDLDVWWKHEPDFWALTLGMWDWTDNFLGLPFHKVVN